MRRKRGAGGLELNGSKLRRSEREKSWVALARSTVGRCSWPQEMPIHQFLRCCSCCSIVARAFPPQASHTLQPQGGGGNSEDPRLGSVDIREEGSWVPGWKSHRFGWDEGGSICRACLCLKSQFSSRFLGLWEAVSGILGHFEGPTSLLV